MVVGTHSAAKLLPTTIIFVVVGDVPGVDDEADPDRMTVRRRRARRPRRRGRHHGRGRIVHGLLAVAALGLAALIAASAAAFSAVKWAGAAYLVWLAFGLLRSALAREPATTTAPPPARADGSRRAVPPGRAAPTSSIRKIALFFLALLPSVHRRRQRRTRRSPSSSSAPGWSSRAGFFLFAFVFLVAPLRRWRAGGAWKRGLNAAGAGLFAWLAVRLAFAEKA